MTQYRIIEKLGKYRIQYKLSWFPCWLTLTNIWDCEVERDSKEECQKIIDARIEYLNTSWKVVE